MRCSAIIWHMYMVESDWMAVVSVFFSLNIVFTCWEPTSSSVVVLKCRGNCMLWDVKITAAYLCFGDHCPSLPTPSSSSSLSPHLKFSTSVWRTHTQTHTLLVLWDESYSQSMLAWDSARSPDCLGLLTPFLPWPLECRDCRHEASCSFLFTAE